MVKDIVKILNRNGTEAMISEFNRVKNLGEGHRFDSSIILDNDEYLDDFLEGKMEINIPASGVNRAKLADIIYQSFNNIEQKVTNHIDNPGLWNWLMVRLGPMNHLSFDGDKLVAMEKYVHCGDGYRHNLANIAWAKETIETCGYGRLMLIASNRPQDGTSHEREMKFGEAQEQIIQGHILRSSACLQLIDHMYYDEDTEYWKPGIASNDRSDSLRKLKKFLYKLDSTYDVYSMTYEELLDKVERDGRFDKRLNQVDGKWK